MPETATPLGAPGTAADPYRPVRAVVEEVIVESPTIKTFVLRPEVPMPFETGQFIELAVPGQGEAPFTPSSSPSVADRMAVTVMKAGRVTGLLHELKAGAAVGLRGPYGKGYPLEEFAGREILILGGGVGLAPLRSLILALFDQPERFPRIVFCYGARTPEDVIYKKELEAWLRDSPMEVHLTVDHATPDWPHKEGVVTILVDDVQMDLANAVGVCCGPPIMMRFGTQRLLTAGFKPGQVYLSMEKNMSCGVGKCGHCRLGPYFVCKDGPVFTFEQVKDIEGIWD